MHNNTNFLELFTRGCVIYSIAAILIRQHHDEASIIQYSSTTPGAYMQHQTSRTSTSSRAQNYVDSYYVVARDNNY